MSFGKMNTFLSIIEKQFAQDEDGFKTETDVMVAEVRAYREGRHGSEKWANMASFSTATDLFRFRVIPDVEITTDMRILCDGHTFEITSVEDVKGRGMYLEVLAKGTIAEGAKIEAVTLPLRVRCRACGAESEIDRRHIACPACGGVNLERLSGREFLVDSLEVDV